MSANERQLTPEIEKQLRAFLSNLSDQQVANILYIVGEWSQAFIEYCYEHEENATKMFAEMLQEL